MDQSAADVRAASVARLKRAASLPRMKDGRRPAVNGADKPNVSDGDRPEKPILPESAVESRATSPPSGEDALPSQDEPAPLDAFDDHPPPLPVPSPALSSQDEDTVLQTPQSTSRGRPQSRTKSRSFTPQPLEEQSIPVDVAPEGESGSSTAQDTLPTRRVARSPFLNPRHPFPLPATTPPPTLEVLQGNYVAGLFRSQSASRAHALHKLTGGNVSPESEYFPVYASTSSPHNPPIAAPIVRSNTVAGGEQRNAVRVAMMQKLRTRVTNNDAEVQSGTEEVFTMPAIVERDKRKRRRRSHRRSGSNAAAAASMAQTDNDLSSAPTTPANEHAPLPASTPPPQPPAPPPLRELHDSDIEVQQERQKQYYQQRRGPLIEDEDEPPTPPPVLVDEPIYPVPGLPLSTAGSSVVHRLRQPHTSDTPSFQSSIAEDGGQSARIPVVLLDEGKRSPYARQDAFPISALLESPQRNGRSRGAALEDLTEDLASHLRPPSPKGRAAWNGKSSDSWIVHSPGTSPK